MPDRNALAVPAISRIGLSPPHVLRQLDQEPHAVLVLVTGRSGSMLPIGTRTKLGGAPGAKLIQPTSMFSKSHSALNLR